MKGSGYGSEVRVLGSGETDIEVTGDYVASSSMNHEDRTWKIDDIEL